MPDDITTLPRDPEPAAPVARHASHIVFHPSPRSGGLRRDWTDIVGCVVFLALAAQIVVTAPALSVALIPVVAYEVASGLVFLVRGRPIATLRGFGPRVAAYGGTFAIPLFLAVAQRWAPQWITPVAVRFPAVAFVAIRVGSVLIALGTLFAAWGLWYLRRSISLVPAARALVTRGPYAIARHPLYLAYILSYTGLTVQHPTVPMLIAFITWFALTYARVVYEERILRTVYPEYAAYAARVGAFGRRPVPLT